METLKKIWGWIVLAFSVLVGLFLVERSQRKKAEAQLENAETNAKDKVLEYKQSEEANKIKSEEQKIEELKKQHSEPEKELTPKEVEEYWRNKK